MKCLDFQENSLFGSKFFFCFGEGYTVESPLPYRNFLAIILWQLFMEQDVELFFVSEP